MSSLKKSNYYVTASIRRFFLDKLQEKHKDLYQGIVLDIGGRDRGLFVKPRDKVKKWIFADLNPEYQPDIQLDVTDMHQINSNEIDVVNAIELFEHVLDIEAGLKECHRVLKKGGIMILSVPFLTYIHADPYDFQRWTFWKWQNHLTQIGFKIEKMYVMGNYFSHLSESLKDLMKAFERRPSKIGTFLLRLLNPFFSFLIKFDNGSFVKNDIVLKNYHNGYFIIAKKN